MLRKWSVELPPLGSLSVPVEAVLRRSSSRACQNCGENFAGYGKVCGSCRSHGARIRRCEECDGFFSGFSALCEECHRSGVPVAPTSSRESIMTGSTSPGSSSAASKICQSCFQNFDGFGDTCSACRLGGTRIRKCVGCEEFFAGYTSKCSECLGRMIQDPHVVDPPSITTTFSVDVASEGQRGPPSAASVVIEAQIHQFVQFRSVKKRSSMLAVPR